MSLGHAIAASNDTYFRHTYEADHEEMRRLYEQAKRDQWNASKDIAWDAAPSPDGRIIADELVDIYGSPLGEGLSEADKVDLNRRIAAWRLGVLMYGEQGALLACSQMVDLVEGTDHKFFQATQVMDEARHNEVLKRYIAERLDDITYPMPKNEVALFDSILGESRWYLKTIALQLVAETFAVALFKMMADSSMEPLLREAVKGLWSLGSSFSSARTLYDFSCLCGIPLRPFLSDRSKRTEYIDQHVFRLVVLQFQDQHNWDMKVARKCCFYFFNLYSFCRCMINQACCETTCQCGKEIFYRVGSLISSQKNWRFIFLKDERFAPPMYLEGTIKLIDGCGVVSTINPTILGSEIELGNSGVLLDGRHCLVQLFAVHTVY